MMAKKGAIRSRAMWLLHAMAAKGGARVPHLRGYGPRNDELDEDITALITSGMLDSAYFNGSSTLVGKFTPKGVIHLAQWRVEVLRAVETRKEVL